MKLEKGRKYHIINRTASTFPHEINFDIHLIQRIKLFLTKYFDDNILEKEDIELKKNDKKHGTNNGLYFKKNMIESLSNDLSLEIIEYMEAKKLKNENTKNSCGKAKKSCDNIVEQIKKLLDTMEFAFSNPTFMQGLLCNNDNLPNRQEKEKIIDNIKNMYKKMKDEEPDKFEIDCVLSFEERILLDYTAKLSKFDSRLFIIQNLLNILALEILELKTVFQPKEKAKAKAYDNRIEIIKNLGNIFFLYTNSKPEIDLYKNTLKDTLSNKKCFTTFFEEFIYEFKINVDRQTAEKYINYFFGKTPE